MRDGAGARLKYTLGLTSAGLLFLALALGEPHFHDFSEWIFQGQVLAFKLTDAERVAQYGIAPYPVPNSLSLLLLAGLNLIVNPVVAGKVFLLGLVCLWAFA
ncbi:MAG: hypothetical protein AAF680_02925, partial [Pseudomonadota bacterium]